MRRKRATVEMYEYYRLINGRHVVFEYIGNERDGAPIPDRIRVVCYDQLSPVKHVHDIMEATPEMMVKLVDKHYDLLISFPQEVLDKLKPKELTFLDKVKMCSNRSEQVVSKTIYFVDVENYLVTHRGEFVSAILVAESGDINIETLDDSLPLDNEVEVRFFQLIEIK